MRTRVARHARARVARRRSAGACPRLERAGERTRAAWPKREAHRGGPRGRPTGEAHGGGPRGRPTERGQAALFHRPAPLWAARRPRPPGPCAAWRPRRAGRRRAQGVDCGIYLSEALVRARLASLSYLPTGSPRHPWPLITFIISSIISIIIISISSSSSIIIIVIIVIIAIIIIIIFIIIITLLSLVWLGRVAAPRSRCRHGKGGLEALLQLLGGTAVLCLALVSVCLVVFIIICVLSFVFTLFVCLVVYIICY